MAEKLRAGVIGVGFMGALHCKAYSLLNDIDFVGVFDADQNKAKEIAVKFNTNSFVDLESLLNNVDIVSVATPTTLHYEICLKCIDHKKHMLIEKPIAATLSQAKDLVDRIEKSSLLSAVGYIERFNPAVIELFKLLDGKEIKTIEAIRVAPRVNRANDVSAIFDLMIHDIDIVMALTKSIPKYFESVGEKIDSDVYNRVSAQIIFNNGVKALLFADKNANKKERKIKIKCEDFSLEADLINKKIYHSKKGEYFVENQEEPIVMEVKNFVESVKTSQKPVVSAKDSFKSFQVAWDFEEKIKQ